MKVLSQEQTVRVKSRRLAWPVMVAIAITVLLWASAFVGIRVGVRAYSPAHLALLRFGCASLVLLALARPLKICVPARRDLFGIAGIGFLGIGLYNLALNAGEAQVNASSASFVVNAAPAITALTAMFWLHERLNAWGWAGLVISFSGVALISLGGSSGLHFEPAVGLVLIAALVQSLYFVLQKPYLKKYRPVEFTAYAIWSATLFLLVFLPGMWGEVQQARPDATLAVIYLGVFPAALAYVSWAYVLARLPAARAASFLYLVPPLVTGIAWLWQGEEPGLLTLLGGLITLAGVALVSLLGKDRSADQ